jgi:hypothetical protein
MLGFLITMYRSGRRLVGLPLLLVSCLLTSYLEDQVQWHRSLADMMRWLEEFELKHAEFIRCINGFGAMASAWSTIAAAEARDGYAAFARHQADIYHQLREDAEKLFKKNAEPSLFESRDNLIGGIQKLRRQELAWLWRMAGVDPGLENDADPAGLEKAAGARGKGRETEHEVDGMDIVMD